jgi:hypothetical protein
MSQIKLIPTTSWLVYFVLKAQPFKRLSCARQSLKVTSECKKRRKKHFTTLKPSRNLGVPDIDVIKPFSSEFNGLDKEY